MAMDEKKTLYELNDKSQKPPPPEACCRYETCNSRREIYINDVAFKGYIKVHCSEDCKVDYHIGCWKNLKESVHKKYDKDMLGTKCVTPDCQGFIDDLSVYGEDGLVISSRNRTAIQEKTKVKTSSKQCKKEKKSRKFKVKEKGQDNPHLNKDEVPDVGIVLPALPAPSVCSSDSGDSVMTLDVDTHVDDISETTMLHQDAAYVLKRDEPQERTLAPKVSKAKTKKKKKEALTVEVDFADKDSRNFLTDADVPDSSRITQTDTWYFSEQYQSEVLVTEEDRNEMFALYLHFEGILKTNGPLKVNDFILLGELSRLTSEHQGIVSKHGGLAQFLLTAPYMFSILENYVCRKEDLSKCRDILGREKIVWASLPSGSHPRGDTTRETLLGRTPWDNQSHPKKGNNEENYQKPSKMNWLDMFKEGDLNEETHVLNGDDHPPGITRQGLVFNQMDPITVSLTEQSEDEEDDDSDDNRECQNNDHSKFIRNEPPIVDNYKVPFPSVQDMIVNDEILTQGSTPFPVYSGVAQGATHIVINNGVVTQPPVKHLEDKVDMKGSGDLTDGVNGNEITFIPYSDIAMTNNDSGNSFKNFNRKYRSQENGDANPRCHSEISSGSRNSDTIPSSGVSSNKLSNLTKLDALTHWKKAAKKILSLFPELRTDGKEDDDTLFEIFSSQLYELLKGLQDKREDMHLKRSFGTCTHTPNVLGVNTVPFRTYEEEYLDIRTKYMHLQDTLRLREEEIQQENKSAQREKRKLLELVLDHEARAREAQLKLKEYNQMKEIADQMKVEKENWIREKDGYQRKMDEMSKECQRQRAIQPENIFDNELSQLSSDRHMPADLPNVAHLKSPKSKSPKLNFPSSQNWPSFDTPPPLPGSTVTGTSTPISHQQGQSHPVRQMPKDGTTSMPTIGTTSTVSVVLQVPGSTTPLAPRPVVQHQPDLTHLPIPICNPNNGAGSPFLQGVTREKVTHYSAKVNHVPQSNPNTPVINSIPATFLSNSQERASKGQTTTAPKGSYQRMLERLRNKFPHYNKVQLTNFLKVVRVNNGNSLSGLTMEGIMQKVADLISEAAPNAPQLNLEASRESLQVTATPAAIRIIPPAAIPAAPSKNPWSMPVEDVSTSWQNGVYDEEAHPCVICHEEMALKEAMDLECGHRFHADCVGEWLDNKSTCPTCRKFTKLKQDYPPLKR